MEMIALSQGEFKRRMLKRQERRKEGRRQAKVMVTENYFRTRDNAYRARHASQNAN